MVTCRVLVLASGSGTLLQALLDACTGAYPARVVALGTDNRKCGALDRARSAGVDSFSLPLTDRSRRGEWDAELTARVASYEPDLVVSAGFMKLLGPRFLDRFAGRTINTHPALLPAFAGMHAVRDALAHGVKVTGATVFMVDEGVDTGQILAQRAVPVQPGDNEATLHERIKVVERQLLIDTVRELALITPTTTTTIR